MLLVGEKQHSQLKGENMSYYELSKEAEGYRSRIDTVIERQHDVIMDKLVDELTKLGKTEETFRDPAVEKARLKMYKEFYLRIMDVLEQEEQDIIEEVLAQID